MDETAQQRWNRRVLTELAARQAEHGLVMPEDSDAAAEVRAVRDEWEARDAERVARSAGTSQAEQE